MTRLPDWLPDDMRQRLMVTFREDARRGTDGFIAAVTALVHGHADPFAYIEGVDLHTAANLGVSATAVLLRMLANADGVTIEEATSRFAVALGTSVDAALDEAEGGAA